jgi:DNA-binding MarR family transcriptional regulator
LEIESQGAMTAAQLVQMLGLEKSSVSRMLGKLVRAGEIQEVPSKDDARFKELQLTAQGKESVARINQYGSMRVVEALAHLTPSRQHAVAEGLSAYAHALAACRNGEAPLQQDEIEIVAGYRPGMIGRISEMHASYYSRHYGFGYFLKAKWRPGWLTSPGVWMLRAIVSGLPFIMDGLWARSRLMGRIWATTRRIFAGLSWMTIAVAVAWVVGC